MYLKTNTIAYDNNEFIIFGFPASRIITVSYQTEIKIISMSLLFKIQLVPEIFNYIDIFTL